MIVTLLVNGKAIESRPVPTKNFSIEGYFEGLKNDMLEQNEDIIDLTGSRAEFVISNFDLPKKIIKN